MTIKENESRLREIVSLIAEQETYRLKKELEKVTLRLIMSKGAHVPDTLTRIRVLPSVAVVGQKEKVERTDKGQVFLDIYVKFLPTTEGVYKNLISLSKLCKAIPGVKIVKVLSYAGRKIVFKGKPIVI